MPVQTLPLTSPNCLVVTEEELALALEEGEEIIPPSGPATVRSTNGLTEADSEYDPLIHSMEETKWVNSAFLIYFWIIQDEFAKAFLKLHSKIVAACLWHTIQFFSPLYCFYCFSDLNKLQWHVFDDTFLNALGLLSDTVLCPQ